MYLDAQVDRVEEQSEADFDSMVEAVRVGSIIARDRKAHDKWNRRNSRRLTKRGPMADAELEAAILRIGEMFPGSVSRVVQ